MDINRVRYFHIFAETGSLVKACEILHISQPALSKALRLLEAEVGFKLLESEGRGLKLTKAGISFRKETADLLHQWMTIPTKLETGAAWKPTKIGTFEVFSTYFLDPLIKFIEMENLELHEYGPGQLEQKIVDGTVDIGITYLPIPKAEVDFIEVTKVQMGVYGLKKFKNQETDQLPFVVPLMPNEGTPSKVVGLDGWPDHKFKRNIKYKVSMMESAMQLCRLGQAVAYLPTFVVELHNQHLAAEYKLVELNCPVPQKERKQSVFLVSKSGAEESSLQRQIAKCLRNLN